MQNKTKKLGRNRGIPKTQLGFSLDQNSGHLRLCQQPRAAHALCSDKNRDNIPTENAEFMPKTIFDYFLFF
jgi:hypothetical protein